ncbi:MAG: hypothetical protein ACOX7F_02430 [Eubacteriales bacterium]|jgi:superfamily I DNA/RNA helicase
MNLYMLVEGRRTEVAVYPAWLQHELPFLRQVDYPFQARQNCFYVVSGFGYPNLLHHIANCVREVNRYKQYDYLVICLDSDNLEVRDRIIEIENLLDKEHLWPKRAQIRVLVQKKCIETWFLGNRALQQVEPTAQLLPYWNAYNVFERDPERMEKPIHYRGSIGDFHCHYLIHLLEAHGIRYSKRQPGAVCTPEYIEQLRLRTRETRHLRTLRNFFDFCDQLREEYTLWKEAQDALEEDQLETVIAEQRPC